MYKDILLIFYSRFFLKLSFIILYFNILKHRMSLKKKRSVQVLSHVPGRYIGHVRPTHITCNTSSNHSNVNIWLMLHVNIVPVFLLDTQKMMVSAPTEAFFDQSIIRNTSLYMFLVVCGCVSVFDCACVFCFVLCLFVCVCVMYSQCVFAAWQVITITPWQPYLLKGCIFWWSTSHYQSKFR